MDCEFESRSVHQFMKITLNGEIYTKTAAMKMLSCILNSHDIDDTLSGEHYMIVLDMLQRHPRVLDKIGVGIKRLFICESPVYRGRCFGIERVDGSSDDFSVKKCLGRNL